MDMTLNSEEMRANLKKALRLGGTLFVVTAVTGLLLGLVEWVTRDAIRRAELGDRAEALRAVMPEAADFKPTDLIAGAAPVTDVQEALAEGGARAGYCITVEAKGYGGPVTLMVGVTDKGAVRAIHILSHSETPGLGAKSTEPEFSGQFANREKLPLQVVKGTPSAPDEIAAISGATITSNAVTGGVNAAVDYWGKNLKGGQ